MSSRIDSLWAWTIIDPATDTEQVISVDVTGLGVMPLIDARVERVQQFRQWASQASKATGLPVTLVRFTTRTELDSIHHPKDPET